MVDLRTVKEQAPDLEPAFRQVGRLMTSKGVTQDTHRAGVLVSFDHSGSTEMEGNRLYSGRNSEGHSEMERVGRLAFAAGLFFDDDGEVPASLFHNSVYPLDDITLGNYRQFLDGHDGIGFGGTSYLDVLRWVIKTAGFGDVDLGRIGGLRGSKLSVKATAPYPFYAAIVTDGEPNRGTEDEIRKLLTLMSQLPIFVQFVGVGEHHFKFLTELDTLDGRLVDNAGFFDAKDMRTQEEFLAAMLSEFATSYYSAARGVGLLTAA
jgi:hypothetical protein